MPSTKCRSTHFLHFVEGIPFQMWKTGDILPWDVETELRSWYLNSFSALHRRHSLLHTEKKWHPFTRYRNRAHPGYLNSISAPVKGISFHVLKRWHPFAGCRNGVQILKIWTPFLHSMESISFHMWKDDFLNGQLFHPALEMRGSWNPSRKQGSSVIT